VVDDIGDFRALDPFFRTVEEGLREYVDGGHFFDLLAEDVVFDFVITVPDYPRHVVGRRNLIELYRGYGATFSLDRCYDLRVHYSEATSSVVLEYASAGKVAGTGYPYSNRYISVVVVKDRKIVGWRDYLDPLRVFAALEGRPFGPDGTEASLPAHWAMWLCAAADAAAGIRIATAGARALTMRPAPFSASAADHSTISAL
jgi:ketosteroid isomerase-like protein